MKPKLHISYHAASLGVPWFHTADGQAGCGKHMFTSLGIALGHARVPRIFEQPAPHCRSFVLPQLRCDAAVPADEGR